MTFNVTEKEANLLIQALAELPAKISMDIIIKLQLQAKEQLEKKEEE